MKSPPPSEPPDSPALLYLLALCDSGGGGEEEEEHCHHNSNPYQHNHINNNNKNKNNKSHSYYSTYSDYFGSMDGFNNLNPFSSSGGGGAGGRGGRRGGKDLQDMNLTDIIQELQRLLPEVLTRFHQFMLRAHKLMSTPSGIDKVLMTLSYTLQLLTPQLPRRSRLPASFRALTTLISDIRVFHRLWGLLGIYSWGHSLLQRPPGDLTVRRIVAAQVLANACFQVLENVAYLASHGVVGVGRRGQARLWVWSSRFWMAHVGLEFWRLQRVREVRVEGARRGLLSVGRKEEEGWRRELVSNCAYAPLTLHWSIQNGMIGPSAVGALGSVAAVIGLQNAWAATA